MEERYRVVFLGLFNTEDYFRDKMYRLGVSSENIGRIIHKAPVILKEDLLARIAHKYAEAVRLAGGKVEVQRHIHIENRRNQIDPLKIEPLENFTMCPRCGYKQLKSEVCLKCGMGLK